MGLCKDCKWFDDDDIDNRPREVGRYGYCERVGRSSTGGLYWYVNLPKDKLQVPNEVQIEVVPVFGCILWEPK